MAKPSNESRAFDIGVASHPIHLPDGTIYDPFAVPALHSSGCEDAPGWTNGFDCSTEKFSQNATLCRKSGFTCAAYVALGWCKESWALGPSMNYPEMNCCACGGGTSVMQLTAECGKASGKCAKAA